MNTIEKKVEAAMRATYIWYGFYEAWFRKCYSYSELGARYAIKCRAMAVVKHDRLLMVGNAEFSRRQWRSDATFCYANNYDRKLNHAV